MNPVSVDSPALSTDRIAFLLSHVDANDRTEWVRMGMAVKDALGDDGLSIWLRWSQSSPKYRHRDAMAVWHSMRKSGISIGTLIVTARNHGAAIDHDDDLHLLPNANWRQLREVERKNEAKDKQHAGTRALLAAQHIDEAARATHPYLARKGFPEREEWVHPHLVQITADGREWTMDNVLLIPMRRYPRKGSPILTAVQYIEPNGRKRFGPRGVVASGAVYAFGAIQSPDIVWWTEGYATGLSVLEALRNMERHKIDSVVVAFSAHGLTGAARSKRGRFRTVIADNDEAGLKFARSTDCYVWHPPKAKADANDYHLEHGIDALRDRLVECLREVRNPQRR